MVLVTLAKINCCSSCPAFFSFYSQRGSGTLPRSSISTAPGCRGRSESCKGAWRGSSHHDVRQHLVHPAHGSQHDGRELSVRCCWPSGLGHVAGSLLPEGGGRWDWMKTSQGGAYWVWVCFTGREMFGWLKRGRIGVVTVSEKQRRKTLWIIHHPRDIIFCSCVRKWLLSNIAVLISTWKMQPAVIKSLYLICLMVLIFPPIWLIRRTGFNEMSLLLISNLFSMKINYEWRRSVFSKQQWGRLSLSLHSMLLQSFLTAGCWFNCVLTMVILIKGTILLWH